LLKTTTRHFYILIFKIEGNLMQPSGLKQIVIFIYSALLFAVSYFTLIAVLCFFLKIPVLTNTEI